MNRNSEIAEYIRKLKEPCLFSGSNALIHREKCDYNSEFSSAPGCHSFSLWQGAQKYTKLSWIFWHFIKATKVTNTDIPAFILHKKKQCALGHQFPA